MNVHKKFLVAMVMASSMVSVVDIKAMWWRSRNSLERKQGECCGKPYRQANKLTRTQQVALNEELIQVASRADSDENGIKRLIDQGASVNYQNSSGRTALMEAANTHVVRALLKAGADVNIQDKMGNTALIIQVGSRDRARALLKAGANVNARTKEGNSALKMVLLNYYSMDRVEMLISAGACPHINMFQGIDALYKKRTVLDIVSGNQETEEFLLEAFINAQAGALVACGQRPDVGELWERMPLVLRGLVGDYIVETFNQYYRAKLKKIDTAQAVKKSECIIA